MRSMVAAAVLLIALGGIAHAITIDGSLNDWDLNAVVFAGVDPNEADISDVYDIRNYAEVLGDSTMFFYFDLYDYQAPASGAAFAIYIDADNNAATGYTFPYDIPVGADVRLWWKPEGESIGIGDVDIQTYNSGWVSSGDYCDAAWGVDPTDSFLFTEWKVPDSIITSDDGSFRWWAFYDNDDQDPDDFAPSDQDGVPGITPEPGTVALLLVGFGFVVGRMRKFQ